MRLFVDRATAVDPNFRVTRDNARVLAQICQRLDGIPLAIELAAARVRVLSVEQIATRLDDRFHLLTGGSRTMLPRQQTLRALIDWSHDLLSEEEQVLFRRLTVFAGGWTLEAAEVVCAFGDIESHAVLDLLASLADKSLVIAETEGDTARYRLLETIRQYAADKLLRAGDAVIARDQHRDWFTSLAERAEAEMAGAEQQAWRERLEADHDNLRAALAWSLESDPAVSVRLVGSLRRFWSQRHHIAEGRRWTEAVLTQASPATSMLDQRAWARLLLCAGVLASEQRSARTYIEQSLPLFRAIGDQWGLSRSLRALGSLLLRGGGPTEQV